MIKYPIKIFFLLTLVVFFTSSKSMNISNLVNDKNVLPKQDPSFFAVYSKKSVMYGVFRHWCFRQAHCPFLQEPYVAECFVNNCSKSVSAKDEFSSRSALINHLNMHLQNDADGLIAETIMHLGCREPIFFIKIKLPTLLLYKNGKKTVYSYGCNGCLKLRGERTDISDLKNDYKQHVSTCSKCKVKDFLQHKNLEDLKNPKPCCRKATNFRSHLLYCHIKFLSELE